LTPKLDSERQLIAHPGITEQNENTVKAAGNRTA